MQDRDDRSQRIQLDRLTIANRKLRAEIKVNQEKLKVTKAALLRFTRLKAMRARRDKDVSLVENLREVIQ